MAITTNRHQDKELDEILLDSIQDKPSYDWSNILDYIQSNFEPEEIYDKGELDDWAVANGYMKAVL